MKKGLVFLTLITILIFTTFAQASSVRVSWSSSPYGWSSSTIVSTANATWFYNPIWTTWAYTPTYFYSVTPRYHTVLYPTYSPAEQQADFNRSLQLIKTQEWAYDTKKKIKERKQVEEQKRLEDVKIDINTTPAKEAPATQPVETKETDQNTPEPKEVQILAQGTVVMKTY